MVWRMFGSCDFLIQFNCHSIEFNRVYGFGIWSLWIFGQCSVNSLNGCVINCLFLQKFIVINIWKSGNILFATRQINDFFFTVVRIISCFMRNKRIVILHLLTFKTATIIQIQCQNIEKKDERECQVVIIEHFRVDLIYNTKDTFFCLFLQIVLNVRHFLFHFFFNQKISSTENGSPTEIKSLQKNDC